MRQELSGRRFGRLIVLARASNTHGRTAWLCRCDCGRDNTALGNNLMRGRTKSCGCFRSEVARTRNTKHGHSGLGGEAASRSYKTWASMIQRCTNDKSPDWKYYGGRGIAVCERWRNFDNFLADMGERPPGTSIDRFPDKNGNYEPGNCRWATSGEQNANRRRYILAMSESDVADAVDLLRSGHTKADVARRFLVKRDTLLNALDFAGVTEFAMQWPDKRKAAETKVRKRKASP